MSNPNRPSTVPANAWWHAQDKEWVLGDKDAEGRLVGVVTYWRPDGSLVCTCDHAAGLPHGIATRFHETGEVSQHCEYVNGKLHGLRSWFMTDGKTTEKPRDERLAKTIWRGELDYENGRVVSFRYFDRAGNPVDLQGNPLKNRPANVPSSAVQNKTGMWTLGQWEENGNRIGTHRFWTADGKLDHQSTHDGESYRLLQYHANGERKYECEINGKNLVGAASAWRKNGKQLVRAIFGHTSTIEHLGVDGVTVRATTYAPVSEEVPPALKFTEWDKLVLDAIIEEGEEGAVDAAEQLSPTGMAYAIAHGWGGNDDRDAKVARLLRQLVKKLAPPSLATRLADQQMERMPRMQTPQRVTTVVEGLANDAAVDADALREALVSAGGPGQMLAMADPNRALAFLRSRVDKEGKALGVTDLGLTALAPVVGRFHSISRLYCKGNRLTTLPDEVGDMFLLSLLHLGKNRIRSLPRTLAWLPNLRTLHLSENELTSIPSTVLELPELSRLSLGDNRLSEVPEAIGDITSLTHLGLENNPLRALPKSLVKLPLKFLHLGNHQWEEPPAVLAECSQLETLWVASRALKRLPAAICKLPKLRELVLWYSSVSEIPDELYEATQLKALRIKNNPLPDAVYAKLAEALPNTTIY